MINDLKKDSEERMNKTLESLEHGFAKVRTGRAHPSILNGVMVSYYGSDVPLNQVANVGVEDSRTLLVQPFERSMVSAIDKAIRESDLGLNPITADAIRVPMAALMKNPANQSIVWVKTAPERFEPRTVTAEPLDGTHVAVTSGLKAGDRVAVRAATLINQIR